MLSRIIALIQKDVAIQLRQIYSLAGVILYVVTCIFIVYRAFDNLEPRLWNAMFWVIFLFIGINATLGSFTQERYRRTLYYYSHFDPVEILLSKNIYNSILLFGLGTLLLGMMQLFLGIAIRNLPQFFLVLLMASIGLSVIFSLVSSITAEKSNAATMLSILSLPLSLSILLTVLKLSANAIGIINDTDIGSDVIILLALDLILMGLSLILFPYLWKS